MKVGSSGILGIFAPDPEEEKLESPKELTATTFALISAP